jgi:hypothetical protein
VWQSNSACRNGRSEERLSESDISTKAVNNIGDFMEHVDTESKASIHANMSVFIDAFEEKRS